MPSLSVAVANIPCRFQLGVRRRCRRTAGRQPSHVPFVAGTAPLVTNGETMSESPDPSASLKDVDPRLYDMVAQRRLQWDSLLWQVPVLSLTAQAFLLTIALAPDSKQFPRALASALGFVAAVLAMHLMSRDRQAEITDAHWLRDYEQANFGVSFSGRPWQEARARVEVLGHAHDAAPPTRALTFMLRPVANALARYGGFVVWMFGFALFAVASAVNFVITFVAPNAI